MVKMKSGNNKNCLCLYIPDFIRFYPVLMQFGCNQGVTFYECNKTIRNVDFQQCIPLFEFSGFGHEIDQGT